MRASHEIDNFYIGAWGWIDMWAHRLKLPRWLQNKICDRYDRSLGV